MNNILAFFMSGVILGLSAGFSPGPLLTLVISETLQHGVRAGIKVSLAPLITDLPIILLSVYLFSELSSFDSILGLISISGGLFILSLAYQNFRIKGVSPDQLKTTQGSLIKGILTNCLSPHPYLFWFSVGAPIISKANDQSQYAPLVFIISFYLCLLGSKCLLATVLGNSRSLLSDSAYNVIMRVLGVALCVLALLLFYDGLKLLNLL